MKSMGVGVSVDVVLVVVEVRRFWGAALKGLAPTFHSPAPQFGIKTSSDCDYKYCYHIDAVKHSFFTNQFVSRF